MIKLEKILTKDFDIEFTEIILTKKNGTKLIGKGNISQNEVGLLELKMYSKVNNANHLLKEKRGKAGKYIPKRSFYEFKGIDTYGHQWTSNGLLLNLDIATNSQDIIIRSDIEKINKESDNYFGNKKTTYRLMFRKYFRLPYGKFISKGATNHKNITWNNDVFLKANFIAANYEILIFESEDWYFVDITAKTGRLHKGIIINICESLQLISSKHVYWEVFEKYEPSKVKLTIRSFNDLDKLPKIVSPLDVNSVYSNDIWELFIRYFEFVVKVKSAKYHFISSSLFKIIQSKKSALEIRALTETVAIEGILKEEFSKYYEHEEEFLNEISILKKQLKRGYSKKFFNRIHGLISNINRPSAMDYLKFLYNNKLILKREVLAWKNIRNRTVHADKNHSVFTQEYLNLLSICLLLFYKLIFLVIGYKGYYDDLGSYGWPEKKWTKVIKKKSA